MVQWLSNCIPRSYEKSPISFQRPLIGKTINGTPASLKDGLFSLTDLPRQSATTKNDWAHELHITNSKQHRTVCCLLSSATEPLIRSPFYPYR
uniref:Uncharacterized protein n=1 Tax=Sphaerodactylus townsendi TaxID=933632 RepID=A0ACB8ECE5_9SAUR